MSGPTLQRATALSLIVHATFLLLIVLTVRKTATFVVPSAYVVRLVSPEAASTVKRAKPRPPKPEPPPESPEETPPVPQEAAVSAVAPPEAKAPATEEAPTEPGQRKELLRHKSERLKDLKAQAETRQYLSDRLSALEAKQKLKRIAALKKSISVRAGSGATPPEAEASPSILNAYYLQVQDRIWQHWVFPGAGVEDITAVVSITVFKDGQVRVNGFEKRSGNALFDRSALRAIRKASPLEPPPFEMQIGVIFSPHGE